MRFSTTLAGAALATTLAGAAMAENVLASDPQSFVNYFFQEGIPAQLTTDAVGDPLIEFRDGDETRALFFYDCTDNANCLSVQFYVGYQIEGSVSLERLNEWNSGERRFTRAYAADDGAVRLEMDIATSEDGISFRDFGDLMSLWLDRVEEFEEFIGW